MTELRQQHINEILSLCRSALVDLRAGHAFDIEDFSQAFAEAFQSLQDQGPIPEDDPELSSHRSKLKELDRLRKQLGELLTEGRGDLLEKLSRMTRGRRGLDGYRAALEGGQRGARRGQG